MGSGGIRWDPSGIRWDLSGIRWDLGSCWIWLDQVGCERDLLESKWDLVGSRIGWDDPVGSGGFRWDPVGSGGIMWDHAGSGGI